MPKGKKMLTKEEQPKGPPQEKKGTVRFSFATPAKVEEVIGRKTILIESVETAAAVEILKAGFQPSL